jgi:GNAT superfamily N-acetyltransferase
VRPEFRSLGLGKLLISECEKEAKLWGYNKLHLHVEKQSSSVLGLYLNMKFDPIKDNSNIIFMAKDLDS